MFDSEVPNTLRTRISIVTINIIFCFVGLMVFSSQSWLSSLSSAPTISRTDLHLHLVVPLLGPARLLLNSFSILLSITAVIGFLSAATVKRYSTAMWMLLLVLMLCSESILTILFLIYQKQILHDFLFVLLHKLQTEFGKGDLFSHSINFLQQKFQCCGILKPSDFSFSQWNGEGQLSFPLTCCKLINARSIISWKNPQPENIYDCQSEDGDTRFKQGCFDHVLECINNYSSKSCYVLTFVVLLQVVGILVSFSLCRKIDRQELSSEIS